MKFPTDCSLFLIYHFFFVATDIVPPSGAESMFLFDTYELEITKNVRECKPKQSTRYDDINMNIIKSVIKSILKPLVYICNLSLSSGFFLVIWKSLGLFHYIKQEQWICLQIIGLFHYFLSFQKYLKRFSLL